MKSVSFSTLRTNLCGEQTWVAEIEKLELLGAAAFVCKGVKGAKPLAGFSRAEPLGGGYGGTPPPSKDKDFEKSYF